MGSLIEIDGCTFENTALAASNTTDYKGQAIVAADAGLRIANCVFNNLDRGVRLLAGPTFSSPVKVSGNTFNNVWRGILLKGFTTPTVITHNNFDIAIPTSSWQSFYTDPWNGYTTGEMQVGDVSYGLYLDNSVGFQVEENTFNTTQNLNNAMFPWLLLGNYAYNTGIGTNRIRRNTFGSNLFMASQNSYDNTGLESECNDYAQSPLFAIYAGSVSGLHNKQGYCNGANQDPAGNQFNPVCTQDINFKNNGTFIDYFHSRYGTYLLFKQ